MRILLFIIKEAKNLRDLVSDSTEAGKELGAKFSSGLKFVFIRLLQVGVNIRFDFWLGALIILFFIFFAPKSIFFGSIILVCFISLYFLLIEYRIGQVRKRAKSESNNEPIECSKNSTCGQ